MGIMEQARLDWAQITGDLQGFSKSITITTPDGVTSVTVNGLHSNRSLPVNLTGMNTEGTNAALAHASVSEQLLTAVGYVTRNGKNEVTMVDHKLMVTDSEGISTSYIIRETHVNKTLGVIVFILGDFE